MAESKKKIVNAHMHVFTGDIVPPFLAKSMLIWPFYYLINTRWLIWVSRKYFDSRAAKKYGDQEAIFKDRRKKRKEMINRDFVAKRWYLNIPWRILVSWVTLVATLYFLKFLSDGFSIENKMFDFIQDIRDWMVDYKLYYDKLDPILRIIWIILVFGLFKWSRRFLLTVLELLFPIIKKIIGKKTQEMIGRYFRLGRYSFYRTQRKIAHRALDQLPKGSAILILPMDMEYMGAGKTKMAKRYLEEKKKREKKIEEKKKKGEKHDIIGDEYQDVYKHQMWELWNVVKKDTETKYYPFLFVDPRRYREEGSQFFDYDLVDDKMVLRDCFVKRYMEDRRFRGFKIYPALGYYPFDKYLLPIWRYASENNIPITSHCVFGTIFYRGKKEKEWNFHPVIKQKYGEETEQAKILPQSKNVDFQINFTHPLNYLCILEESFLRKYIFKVLETSKEAGHKSKTDTQKVPINDILKELYGYKDKDTPLTYDLSNLKICLAHYGGEEEWLKYLETDRQSYSQRLMRDPQEAIRFMENSKGDFSWPKINDLWDSADWYSLICSLMIRYKNIYADLSYIIAKKSIYPMIKYTLEKGDNYNEEHAAYIKDKDVNKKSLHYSGKNKLRSRVLFGTDFYVVRNHNSDKDLFIELKTFLSEEEFDLIARENTHNFLAREFEN